MTVPPIGIDLGTSNSVVCAFIDGKPTPIRSPLSFRRSPIVPSTVAWSRENNDFVVGYLADNERHRPNHYAAEVKRKMGTDLRFKLGPHAMRPQEVSALLLKKMVEGAASSVGGEVAEAVISVPANFKDAARQATLDAASIAGLKVPMLVAEPTAAALAFGIRHLDADERVLVFDFGGGTLDITLLQMCEGVIDVERVEGDPQLGGKDIDAALYQWVVDQFSKREPHAVPPPMMEQELKRECELAKIALSTENEIAIRLANYASRGSQPVMLDVRSDRANFNGIISPILDQASACLKRLLAGDGRRNRKVDPRSISRVLLVGGSTYIPAVRDRVSEIIGRDVSADVDPDLAVGMGACIRAAIASGVEGAEDSLMLADVSPFSVGVEVVQPMQDGMFLPGVFSPLIERNEPIPHRSSHVYNLLHPEQEAVTVSVYQGNSVFVAENELIARAELKDIPASTTEEPREVHIHFSFDLSGIVELNMVVPNTFVKARLEADPRQGRMSDEEREKAAARVAQSAPTTPSIESSPRYTSCRPLLDRAEQILQDKGELEAPATARALPRLRQALAGGSEAEITAAEDALTDALLDEGA
jgi:molecular chaperone DnaK